MLKNSLFNVIGATIRFALLILTVPLLIHLIGVDEYGLWTLISAAIGVVGIAEAGLSISTTVFVSRDLATDDAVGVSHTLTVSGMAMLLLATIAAFVLWFGAPTLVAFFPHLTIVQHGVAIKAFQIGALVVWARLLQQIFVGVEQAYGRYGLLNILNTAQAALLNLGLWVVASFGGRTLAMAQWQMLITAVMLIAHVAVVHLLTRGLALRPRWDGRKGREIVRYSAVMMVGSVSNAVFSQCDRLIVGALLGTRILGVYAAVTNMAGQINSFSALPVQPLLPELSKLLFIKNGGQRLIQRVKQATQLNAMVALSLGSALFTFSPLVMRMMVPGTSGLDYLFAFQLAAVVYAVFSINAVAYFILLGTNGVILCTSLQLLSALLSLLLVAIGASWFGLVGAVAGNVGSFVTLLILVYSMRRLDIAAAVWGRWLLVPIVWFLAVLAMNVHLSDSLLIKSTVVGLQQLILFGWFALVYRVKIKSILTDMHARRVQLLLLREK